MSTNSAPGEIQLTLRNTDPPESMREYLVRKLRDPIYSVPNLRYAMIEVTYESTEAVDTRYAIEVTLWSNGDIIRVEKRGPDIASTTNSVYDVLERRIRDWKGRVYYERRRERSAQKEAIGLEVTNTTPQDPQGQIVRMKSFEIKPMFPEDAIEQMELLGHDFYFFLNAQTNQYNVVYRRRAGGYGWIEPAMVEEESFGASEISGEEQT